MPTEGAEKRKYEENSEEKTFDATSNLTGQLYQKWPLALPPAQE
jgi:hypothetical protein